MICTRCKLPPATQDDFESIPQGEGNHLCWRAWTAGECEQGAASFTRDPTKLYAADLRQMGLDLPEHIPGCASVARGSVRFGPMDLTLSDTPENREQRRIVGRMPVDFSEPFTWATVDVEFPKKEKP